MIDKESEFPREKEKNEDIFSGLSGEEYDDDMDYTVLAYANGAAYNKYHKARPIILNTKSIIYKRKNILHSYKSKYGDA